MCRIVFYYCCLCLIFISCEKADDVIGPDSPPKSGTYITSYVTNLMSIEPWRRDSKDSTLFVFRLDGKCATYNSVDFAMIAKSYGDTLYTELGLSTSFAALSDTIRSMHVYAQCDYNDRYKKDELLDDIIEIKYQAFFDFISSNYQNYSSIHKTLSLSEFNRKPVRLFMRGFELYFKELPPKSGVYPLSIEIKTYTDSIRTTFDLKVN